MTPKITGCCDIGPFGKHVHGTASDTQFTCLDLVASVVAAWSDRRFKYSDTTSSDLLMREGLLQGSHCPVVNNALRVVRLSQTELPKRKTTLLEELLRASATTFPELAEYFESKGLMSPAAFEQATRLRRDGEALNPDEASLLAMVFDQCFREPARAGFRKNTQTAKRTSVSALPMSSQAASDGGTRLREIADDGPTPADQVAAREQLERAQERQKQHPSELKREFRNFPPVDRIVAVIDATISLQTSILKNGRRKYSKRSRPLQTDEIQSILMQLASSPGVRKPRRTDIICVILEQLFDDPFLSHECGLIQNLCRENSLAFAINKEDKRRLSNLTDRAADIVVITDENLCKILVDARARLTALSDAAKIELDGLNRVVRDVWQTVDLFAEATFAVPFTAKQRGFGCLYCKKTTSCWGKERSDYDAGNDMSVVTLRKREYVAAEDLREPLKHVSNDVKDKLCAFYADAWVHGPRQKRLAAIGKETDTSTTAVWKDIEHAQQKVEKAWARLHKKRDLTGCVWPWRWMEHMATSHFLSKLFAAESILCDSHTSSLRNR